MSRIESGRMVLHSEEFSFAKALEQVNTIISGQCRDKGLHYECRVLGHVAEYYIGDEMKLRQVMINILGNAVKFTPAGGKILFTIEELNRFDNKATLRFVFSNTGIGMSPEYLPHLFDSFSQEDSSSTSRYGSTGLGMPITRSIVEMMNGNIEVASEKGTGSVFTFTVTLGESSRQDTGYEDKMVLEPHHMRVLVIDDDPVACEHARIVLGQVGIECEIAQSGAAGVEMVRMHHARREAFTLILVDWKMPEMDGVDSFVSKPLFAGTVMDEFKEAFRIKNQSQAEQRADLKGRHILLAEDVAINAEIMVMILGVREIDVDLAENGRIAVDKFAESPVGYYDAVLMDMRMPEMDGLEATRTIRALPREDAGSVPIIALTANAFDEDVQRSMQAGLNAHLSKPINADVLYETLENLIRQ